MATASAAMAPRVELKDPEGFNLYARFALGGALSCSITHSAFTPVDVYVPIGYSPTDMY